MIKKQNLTILLILLSLVSMLAIQAYFLRSDFLTKKEDFKNSVNASLELIVADIQEDWEYRKNVFLIQDLKDTNLVRLEYDLNNGVNTSISLIETKTNDRLMKYVFWKPFDPDSMTKEALFNKVFGWNKEGKPNDGTNYSLGATLDSRLTSHEDTLSVNKDLLDSLLSQNFEDYGVQADYNILYLPKGSTYQKQADEFVSNFFELSDKNGEPQVGVVIQKPFWEIVRRSGAVIAASFSAIVLMVLSFWFLTTIIRKQRSLAAIKDDFIDNVTHELLTPISTLHVSLESLDRYNALDDKQKAKEYLRVSKMELNRITGLVQNVLQVSMHDPGILKLTMTDIELRDTLSDLIDYYRIKSDRPITFELDAFDKTWLHADAYHLNNVLYNVIDNAIKYSKQDPVKINFRASTNGDAVLLDVHDNGIGIPIDDQIKIFDKFHRVSQNDLHEVKGMGIGLYYSKTVMHKMGGDLTLKTSSENGSTFSLMIKKSLKESNV